MNPAILFHGEIGRREIVDELAFRVGGRDVDRALDAGRLPHGAHRCEHDHQQSRGDRDGGQRPSCHGNHGWPQR